MKETNIIFIHEGAVTQAVARMYSIEALQTVEYHVEIWSLRFLRTLWNFLPDEVSWDNYIKIDTFIDFKNRMKELNNTNTLILTSVADNYLNRKIYGFLHSKSFAYLFINPYGSMLESRKTNIWDRIRMAFSSNLFHKIPDEIKKVYHNNIYKLIHHINFEKHIVSCTYPRTVAINSNDYNTYLTLEKGQIREIKEKYILFIDIAYPIHPDFPYFGGQFGDKNQYLKVVNEFFDEIEKKYSVPVVIALHPKSVYTDNDFGERRTIKYKTCQLAKDAEMILTHGSASTALAVIYNKPTLFFYTQYMSDFTPKFVCKLIWGAKDLDKDAVIIDNIDVSSLEITPFAEDKREKCIYTYMTTREHEKTSNDEIIISLCKDFFDKKVKGLSTPFDI